MTINVSETQNLIEFVRTTLNSFPKWDVVTFFHNNPFAAENAQSIARFAGREEAEVEDVLPTLVENGVLTARPAGLQTIYRLTGDEEIRGQVATFVAACEDRDFRTRAIQQVIDGLGDS